MDRFLREDRFSLLKKWGNQSPIAGRRNLGVMLLLPSAIATFLLPGCTTPNLPKAEVEESNKVLVAENNLENEAANNTFSLSGATDWQQQINESNSESETQLSENNVTITETRSPEKKVIEVAKRSTESYANSADLESVDLQQAFLNNADLAGVNLTKAKLENAQLKNANLSGANLNNAQLANANLAGADLTNTQLLGADLTNADLSGAKLNYANLAGAKLAGAKLAGAKLNGANLANANLSDSRMSGTDETSKKSVTLLMRRQR